MSVDSSDSIRVSFDRWDLDKDGKITREEGLLVIFMLPYLVKNVLTTLMNQSANEADIDKMIASLDTNKSGKIEV